MPFKISTQSEKLVIVRGANRVKSLFLRPDVFIEIWFLNIFWTQNLIFRKILSPQNHFSNIILSKSARTKNSRFKNWSICRKKHHFKIRHFFKKFHFKFLIFKQKVYFKIMPFKISTKSENYVVFPGANWVRPFFSDVNFWSKSDFSMKIELKNWVSGKYFLSRIWLFEKFFIIKSAGTKNSQYRNWYFGNFSFQNFIVQENACFRIWFFSENFISNSDFQWTSLLQSHDF